MVDLGHLYTAFNRVDLVATLQNFFTLISNRALVTADQLLSLSMLLIAIAIDGLVVSISRLARSGVTVQRICLILWMEHRSWLGCRLLKVLGHAWIACLRKCHLVHILKEFVFLNQLVFEDHDSGVDLSVFIFETIDLHLRLHVLLVQIFARLQSHRWNLAFVLT